LFQTIQAATDERPEDSPFGRLGHSPPCTADNAPGQANPRLFHQTEFGQMFLGDSLDLMRDMAPKTVDLVITSPPFGLVRKKEYGNANASEYLAWFRPFADQFRRIIRDTGSLVVDIGGSWIPGQPTRSLYHFKLLIMLCEEYGFHLAQEFFWWNPAKLPTPAEWVNIRRIRVKDAVNTVWWLSPFPWPKASNRRVLQPYSPSMRHLLAKGYNAQKRPSGHDISDKFSIDNGASIPPNLLAIPNTESNTSYLRYCKAKGLKPHPARSPATLPEHFIRMLTDKGDLVFDPFGGSCVTGEVAERLQRRWIASDLSEAYLTGALGRFVRPDHMSPQRSKPSSARTPKKDFYRLANPSALWELNDDAPLPVGGGKKQPKT